MTKTKAREEMAKIVKPINERAAEFVPPNVTIKDFCRDGIPSFLSAKVEAINGDDQRGSSESSHRGGVR
jgi:hypothetical protein